MPSPVPTAGDNHPTDSDQSYQYDNSQLDSSDENSPRHNTEEDPAPKPQPMQKRRRVTRACDECRRKKIKCDGKQPCTHCTVYSYDCTYDQPSNRKRNATPQYIEALESQLKRAKALLHAVLPEVDLSDPSIDARLQNGLLPQLPMPAPRPPRISIGPTVEHLPGIPPVDERPDSHLETMVKATGQLDLDEEGNWDYHGHSSGVSFMRGLQKFGDMFQIPPDRSPSLRHRTMSQDPPTPSSLQSPGGSPRLPSNVSLPGKDLPNKKEAYSLCGSAIMDAGAMIRVVHLPTFYRQLDRLYDVRPEHYETAETAFLPLLYAVLALGKLYSKGDHNPEKTNYDTLIDEGFKYFNASRQLLDITDCRDLTSLQAVIFMIQFLQSSAKLNTCYAYIGVALRSALRMGLHRSFNANFNPIEAETRKRIFWVIRRMDTYVGAMLGLPRFLEDEDIDQEWPVEVDDEYITETKILPMPDGQVSVMAAFNAHTRIVQVLSKICKYVYPTKRQQGGANNSMTYTVGYSKIRELEQNLAQWLDELPMALKPGGEAPPIIIRVQQLLRMAFGHAQLLLYRPFLHYVAQEYQNRTIDPRAFACASACVSVSRNIIHISTEMRRRGLLAGAYWFSMYTTFFSVVSVLYFILENATSPTSFELLRDAVEGKEVLAFFAKRSMAADRCSTALKSMFERLPESIRHSGEIIESKKRRQGSSPQSLAARPNLLKQDEIMGLRRASTFPESVPNGKRTAHSHILPLSQAHLANLGLEPTYNPSSSSPDFFDAVPGLTPTSSNASLAGFGMASTHSPHQRASFPSTPLSSSVTSPSDLSVPMADILNMMFPSTDPLAYPNQPMTMFENRHAQVYDHNTSPPVSMPHQLSGIDTKPQTAMFGPSSMSGESGRGLNDNEAQLFGPMPMYLMQNAQMQQGFPAHSGSPSVPMQDAHMQFSDVLNQEDWAQTFLDPNIGLSNTRQQFSGSPQFVPPGPPMSNWR